jgi:O-antigen/teichoic acid export membrane protein
LRRAGVFNEGPSVSDPSPSVGAARDAGAYLAAMVVTRALGFVMVPIYARTLGARELGVLELLETADLTAITLFSAALADPVIRNVRAARGDEERRRVISTTVLALCVLGAAVSLLGVFASPTLARVWVRDPARVDVLRMTFASVAFQGVLEVPLAVLRGEGRAGAFVAWTLSRAALGFALNVLLVVSLRMGVAGICLSSLITAALYATVLGARTLRDVGLGFDLSLLRRLLRFGWPLLPGALALIALGHTRAVHLNAFCSLEEVGVWSLGARFGVQVSASLGSPLRNAWSARMYAVWAEPAGPRHFARAATLFVGLYASAALGLSLLAPELVAIIGGRGFEAARWVIPSVAAGYALREVGEFFRNNLLVGGDARALAWFEPLVAALDFALGWYAVKRWGLNGALAVGPLVFLIYALGLFVAARRVLPVPYHYRAAGAIAAAAVILGVLGARVRTGSLALDGLAHLGLAMVLPGALLVGLARSPEGRAMLGALRRSGAR